MTAYTLAWGWNDEDPSGQHTVQVSSVAELDAALDRLTALAAADGTPRFVDVYEGAWAEGEPTRPYGFQLVWGHPQRVALTWLGDQPGIAVDASLPYWPEPIGHDQDEATPRYTRLTPQQARSALRQYVQTGQRPTNVDWAEA
jgi:hypothetical protein